MQVAEKTVETTQTQIVEEVSRPRDVVTVVYLAVHGWSRVCVIRAATAVSLMTAWSN